MALEVLDVGQGTAVLLHTRGRTLLYDSGPGDGRGQDLARSVVEPALARLGAGGPDRVVISHGDLDHAGGLATLLKYHPDAEYLVSLPAAHVGLRSCRLEQGWSERGARFAMLHPSAGLPYLGNDSSCVLSVRSEAGQILLAGDISRTVEMRLLRAGLARHRVLLVPHHGSLSSSSVAFIERVRPQVAVATAALGNRFGFPREDVLARYAERGVEFWSTGACGAIRLRLRRDGKLEASSARRVRNRIWRHPAAPNCP
jgi:competence protein ComEC